MDGGRKGVSRRWRPRWVGRDAVCSLRWPVVSRTVMKLNEGTDSAESVLEMADHRRP